ncbi:hypothetical protein SMD11_7050 [Streptomyces albireticuli]|uniref:Uncharacterized protein n=2 Tax=Streptomyces albireticuli TaxID=1940 RepID=A0A1Z2LE84_9ACTN|nr:hypothetical protein SMD11_7050 [Streptomyces albireticuli]
MSRFSWCRRIILNYSHIKIEKGTTKITGTARYAVQQDIGLDPNSNKFGEHVDVTLIEKHGTVKSPQVSFESGCTGCNPLYARPWQGFTAIGEQETKQKDFNRYVPIQNGTKVDVDWGWEMVIKHAGVALDTKITWGDVGARCDNKVAGNRGCVVPAFTPTLYIDYAKRQAAAAMIVEAQQKNLQHWGLRGKGKPLTRLADDKETQKNRDITRPSDWIPPDGLEKGSCDEFPFASTYQSGTKGGVHSGDQCAQLFSWQSPNGDWWVEEWEHKNEIVVAPCIRANTPLIQNTSVGGDLGRFTQDIRLLDADPYWVQVIDTRRGIPTDEETRCHLEQRPNCHRPTNP